MCDELDAIEDRRAAQEEFTRRNNEVLAGRAALIPSRTDCIECGEDLPELRQLYRFWRCVDCQQVNERMNRRGLKND